MTRLVQISVIVNDKRGNPIVGLTQRGFSVFDNKSEQQIQVFSADKNPATGAREATVPPDAATYSKVMKTGVADSREVRVAANATDLCVITLDLSNGNMGSVYVQISRYFHGPLRAPGNQDSSH